MVTNYKKMGIPELSSDEFFATLRDGAWHSINDLATHLGIPVDKLAECVKTLSDQGIITYQEDTQRIKIKPEWKRFLPDENLATTCGKSRKRQNS